MKPPSRVRTLRALALAPWLAALVMMGLLIYRVERLKTHVEEMGAGSKGLLQSSHELQRSIEDLDRSVLDLEARLREREQGGQNPPDSVQARPETSATRASGP